MVAKLPKWGKSAISIENSSRWHSENNSLSVMIVAGSKKAGTITREDYVARIEKGRIRMEELDQIKSAVLEELDSLQAVSEPEKIPDEKLAEFSVLESFDKDRLKTLIDKVIVYGADAIEIVWKVGNPFKAEIGA